MLKIIPSLLHLCLTDFCQLRCKHCYFGEYERKRELTLNEVSSVVDKFFIMREWFKGYGYNYARSELSITGGEPMLYSKLIPFIKMIAPKFDKVKFLTNGLIYDKKTCRTLLQHSNVLIYQVSLDGMEDTHNFIRGYGTFSKIVSNIKQAKKDFPEMFLQVSCNVHDKNLNDMVELSGFCKEIGADKIFFDRYVKYWESGLNILTKDEYDRFMDNLNKATELYSDDSFLVYTDRSMQISDYVCKAGVGHQVCCANGDRLICSRFHVKSGNWFKDDLDTLIKNALHWENIALQLPERCISCKKQNVCNGGMRCISYATLHRFDKEDIHCNKYEAL